MHRVAHPLLYTVNEGKSVQSCDNNSTNLPLYKVTHSIS
jgi:hypothetical protein